MKRTQLLSIIGVLYILFVATTMLFSHEGHHKQEEASVIDQLAAVPSIAPQATKEMRKDHLTKIIHWLGRYHLVILHFPIALVVMTAISELLFYWYGSPLFDQAARFMIIAAAITAIPTALFGLALGYDAHYNGMLVNIFWWHRFWGLFTAVMIVVTASLRELHVRKGWETLKLYHICLVAIFISVSLTGFLGGEMTFGG